MRIMHAMLGAALAATGCTSTSSSGISTGNLFVEYRLSLHDGHTTAEASFHVGNGNTGTYVELDGGDEIRCNGVVLAMTTSVVGQIWYEGEIPTTTAPAVFELDRPSGAVETQVAAPTPLAMVSPTASSSVHAGQPLAITWSPAGSADQIDVALNVTVGSCVSKIVASKLPDTGAATIDGSKLAVPSGTSCDVELVISRSKQTSIDGAFEGGHAVTNAFDSADVMLLP